MDVTGITVEFVEYYQCLVQDVWRLQELLVRGALLLFNHGVEATRIYVFDV